MHELIRNRIQDSINIKRAVLSDDIFLETISALANEIICSMKEGRKLILCGNGGSASDALHFAGEITGRFQRERRAWPVVVLNADVATMTAIANDYGYEKVFARQAEGHVSKGDVFIGISTSGNSENVYQAVLTAKRLGAKTAALLGGDGGKTGKEVDYPAIVPCGIAARVQESHIMLIHILCELIEDGLLGI
ncbi:SIS domain-containing protein [Acetatifactor muris]|uniref:Phosphoheptose isomerase n=1 Tax=Acetatifactor muris TaxID=879566 RepID=A0A2K4ZCH9_9FIRM|nr:SIS domain-containing protein [Acetatifactor muris]MCR2046562.1 SIS domain-containing protein [Acetatifactor muris]SOY28152.1 Phosphoheptose isomerase 1 [Acetatifactor muris]